MDPDPAQKAAPGLLDQGRAGETSINYCSQNISSADKDQGLAALLPAGTTWRTCVSHGNVAKVALKLVAVKPAGVGVRAFCPACGCALGTVAIPGPVAGHTVKPASVWGRPRPSRSLPRVNPYAPATAPGKGRQ